MFMRKRFRRLAKHEAKDLKWAIEVQKTGLEKRNLIDLLLGLGFELVEGIEYPALASPELDACLTSADAFEKAKAVREAFKRVRIDPDFVLGSVIDYSANPPRRHAFLEVDSCVMKMTMGTATITILPPNGLSPTELERWKADYEERQYQDKLERQRSILEPAFFSKRAAKVLELLGTDNPSGEVVNKIYELAEGNPKNRQNFRSQFDISEAEFARFSVAVNSPTVSGDWARHGYDKRPRTANPMSRGEAEQFVRGIASRWLEHVRKSKSE